ncbi:MAG: (Fe-S)-binding protein [Mariprofundaceae bacterium]|nr:(Fe-S)-binding protein [Mariprofundaceae bacterium]
MAPTTEEILLRLPGKNCGQCGYTTCRGFAEFVASHPEALERCVHLHPQTPDVKSPPLRAEEISWHDTLSRPYDLILEQFPDDPGPREVILPFNIPRVMALGLQAGDIAFGRPSAVGCPVTHVGRLMAPPHELDGTITWCVVGPMAARTGSVEIGNYTPVAYEGIVRYSQVELHIGQRYYFLPRYCMLQSRHSGLISQIVHHGDEIHVRLEGIWVS